MPQEPDDINEILENYEKQFANTGTAEKIVAAKGLMKNKLHAATAELCRLAIHAEKEETRLKAISLLLDRTMGKAPNDSDDPADDMFKMLEAASAKRDKARESNTKQDDADG
jgi:hypothetical protein